MGMDRDSLQLSEFMQYLARKKNDGERLPSLVELSQELGISIATLREQLEVARALGLVEVRPKTGIRRLPYRFTPAVCKSLSYAATVDSDFFFHEYADLRTHVESAYWQQAVSLLTPEDHHHLKALVERAFTKLNGRPIQMPHGEHRELHLCIYRRLGNPFVMGILEAYWDAYEAVGLSMYTDISYLKNVWNYHSKMVDAICSGDTSLGYQALIEHTDLLLKRERGLPKPVVSRQEFE
jgi:DNA-binding FadR family transcriptional regulator